MEFDREAKNMIAVMALVGAIATGMNVVVADEPNQGFISWSVGLFVVAVLFWIWIRRDDAAEDRAESLQAAEEAARQAEELAKKAQSKAEAELDKGKEKIEIAAETVSDSTDKVEEAIEETVEDAQDTAEEVAEDVQETVEEVVEEVASDEPDDLSKVEGIGPVYQQILKDAGVGTFAAIASKSQDELEAIIKDAGKRRPASIETWAEQAALAAKGDWAGLEKLQDELDGGRRT